MSSHAGEMSYASDTAVLSSGNSLGGYRMSVSGIYSKIHGDYFQCGAML